MILRVLAGGDTPVWGAAKHTISPSFPKPHETRKHSSRIRTAHFSGSGVGFAHSPMQTPPPTRGCRPPPPTGCRPISQRQTLLDADPTTCLVVVTSKVNQAWKLNMSHFAYACKMRCLLNLVLESWEYLWFYLTFWIAILDCGLKLHKLSIHTLVMLQK